MKFSQPWYRKSRKAWFVTLDGKQIRLANTKSEALTRFHELMAKPRARMPQVRFSARHHRCLSRMGAEQLLGGHLRVVPLVAVLRKQFLQL